MKFILSFEGKNGKVPDFVFLAHVVDMMQAMHVPFLFRSFSSHPFSIMPFLIPFWPFSFLVMLIMWAKSKTFLISFYNLRNRLLLQTWAVPRFGFQVAAAWLISTSRNYGSHFSTTFQYIRICHFIISEKISVEIKSIKPRKVDRLPPIFSVDARHSFF